MSFSDPHLNFSRKYKNILFVSNFIIIYIYITLYIFIYIITKVLENIVIYYRPWVKDCYLFLAVFGRRFWILSGGLSGMLPFCWISDLIVSMGVFWPSVSTWFIDLSSGSLNNGRYRWFRSIDIVDEELSPSSSRCGRFDVVMNLLFADFILRRRASVPNKLSPVNNGHNFFWLIQALQM